MIKRDVQTTNKGVGINFSTGIKKNNIVSMVENCSTGKCDCMSDDTKRKINKIEVLGEDDNVYLDLSGTISKEEIEEALKKSTMLH